MATKKFTQEDILKIAELSNINLKNEELSNFAGQFNETLEAVDRLNELNTSGIKGTDQVTGSKNVYREDLINKSRILSQKEALSNAKRQHAGFYVVKGVLDEK